MDIFAGGDLLGYLEATETGVRLVPLRDFTIEIEGEGPGKGGRLIYTQSDRVQAVTILSLCQQIRTYQAAMAQQLEVIDANERQAAASIQATLEDFKVRR